MGMMIEGHWTDEDVPHTSADGSFQRPASRFRHTIESEGEDGFEPEAGRYHLFAAPSCPWAHRTVITRSLKGLEHVVSMSRSDLPRLQGWAFSTGLDDLQPVGGVFHLHQVYSAAVPDYTGRVTVPVLWDRKRRTIVNNESSDIIRMFNSGFGELADASVDLYPEPLRADIDALNDSIYETVNNGVYRCGFARSQDAYAAACRRLFAALEQLEARLSASRYLVGGRLTEADVRLFPTLIRFDAVYYGHFKCNLKRLVEYPSLWAYTRDLYQLPSIRGTVDMEAIKRGYYAGQRQLNPYGIVPLGPTLDLEAPHRRESLSEERHAA